MMKTNVIKRVMVGGMAVVMMAVTPIATPLMTASAASAVQAPGQVRDIRLERAFAREQREIEAQTKRLAHADTLLVKTQEAITKFKDQGKDVSKLEAALAQAKTDLAAAKTAHDAAAGVLTAHIGFNDKGEVTDNPAARKTVLEAHKSMREAHRTLVKAGVDLGKVVRKFRQDNKPAI